MMASVRCCFLLALRLLLLCARCATLDPLLARHGEDVTFTWALPDDARKGILVVAHNIPHNPIFVANTFQKLNVIKIMPLYEDRASVNDTFTQGLVQFSISNVTSQDAGKYLCSKGFASADVLQDCGQMLLLVEAPRDPVITSPSPPVTGTSLTLRCDVVSMTSPRDHSLPMRFRWFEAEEKDGEWRELSPDNVTLEEGVTPAFNELTLADSGLGEYSTTDEPEMETGSGYVEPPQTGGPYWLEGALPVGMVARDDEGRKFACRASEGLDLWSDISSPYTLVPQWAPATSDLAMTPPVTSVVVNVGQSVYSTCSAICRPNCHVTWLKVTHDNQTTFVTHNATLTLVGVLEKDAGWYRCLAKNEHGEAFTQWLLSVFTPPTAEASTGDHWLSDKKHVILLVVIGTVGVALGMIGVSYVVVKYRRRSTPVVWPHQRQRRDSDEVPLSEINRFHNAGMVSHM